MTSKHIPVPENRVVRIHRELLEADLSPTGKVVYAGLLLRPHGSINSLSRRLSLGRDTVSMRIAELEKAGWAERSGSGVIHPCQPEGVRQRKADLFRKRMPYHRYIGEHISFSWLDELVDCDDYVDHARPAFLRNPKTGQPMEYDRIYPEYKIAFEHQGLQHFGPTEKFPDLNKAREQELRDWAKRGISAANEIEVVAITWKDLSLQGILAKIPGGMPLRHVNPKDPYIRCLEQESMKYRNRIEKIIGGQEQTSGPAFGR